MAEYQGAGGSFNHIVGDGLQLVDLQHSLDLWEQSLHHTEIAAGQPLDRGNFRLLERLFPQIARVLKINELETITDDVVEAAASVLVIG